MNEDPAARSHLEEVIRHARAEGPLDDLCALIEKVHETNRKRHEPKLGDDALSFGIQCHRNILRLAPARIGNMQEVEVSGFQTLEISFAGKVWHLSKVASRKATWSPHQIRWDSSEVRLRAARANTGLYWPSEETLFASLPPNDRSLYSTKPQALHYLHLAWQGLDEDGIRIFAGFPRVGSSPWLAVVELTIGRGGTGGLPLPSDVSPTSSPDHDAMAEPTVAVKRRRPAGQEEAPHSGAGS